MKVLIIEDESIAVERLKLLLAKYDPSIEVVACLEGIEESVFWLKENPSPDLLLMDIQLSDGFSFEIFKKVAYHKPVIFTTAYNEFALEAFRYFSIDYLLKPITFLSLQAALNKFKLVTQQRQIDYNELIKTFKGVSGENYKERFLARVGQRLIFVKTGDIAYFRADDKMVYIVDKNGNKFPVDYSLDKLETVLDPKNFFRLNRKVIVSIDSIAQIKPYSNSRLMLHLKDGHKAEELIISRERVPEFRQWAEQ